MPNPNEHLLRMAISAAVYLWANKLRSVPLETLLKRASELSQIVAEKGDVLQFRGGRKGETAHAFNALAEGLAIMSFMPGGVTFLGDHYKNTHPDTGACS
jgi:hypothetical protein